MIITSDVNCGNSPKMAVVRQLNIAFVQGDVVVAELWLSHDAVWEMVGSKTLGGWEAISEQLRQPTNQPVALLEFKHIMSHGDIASSNGTFTTEEGQVFAFCNVYQFTGHSKSAKVEHISSYIIALI